MFPQVCSADRFLGGAFVVSCPERLLWPGSLGNHLGSASSLQNLSGLSALTSVGEEGRQEGASIQGPHPLDLFSLLSCFWTVSLDCVHSVPVGKHCVVRWIPLVLILVAVAPAAAVEVMPMAGRGCPVAFLPSLPLQRCLSPCHTTTALF